MSTNFEEIALQIAKKHFGVETLETQGSDGQDFKDVAVWSIKAALLEAINEGVKASRENKETPQCRKVGM